MTLGSEGSPRAPYVGLRPFEFEESALFYGRGEHIAEMVRTLRNGSFLAVIGSSGSGKSSLVRAGLLPAIASGFMNGDEDNLDWRFVIMRPGLDPYENLLGELLPKLALDQLLDPELVEFRRRTLRGGPRGLVEVVADSLLPESARLVVLIDQFEEVFRFLERGSLGQPRDGSTPERRNDALAFVDMLLATAAERDRQVDVVLTMRSEYLGECEAFLGLSAAIAKSQFLTPRMTREQIQDIIERPIAAVGGRIEPQVVTALLNSLGTSQDQLPRVEHILLRMWDRVCQDRKKQVVDPNQPISLTMDDYRAAGGFESALDQHAEQLYDELGSGSGPGQPSEKQCVAERLFRSLAVRTSQGTLVRRLSSLGEVASITGASEPVVAEVVEHFRQPGCNFLVATPSEPLTGETTLDISHESLLRQWRRMGGWVTAEAEAAAALQRLVGDAQSWREGNRGLLRQPELGLYARWREHVPSPAWALRYVTAEGFSLADRYLDASAHQAQDEERKAHRQRLSIGVALVLATIAGASFGLKQANNAKRAEQLAVDLREEMAYRATQNELFAAGELKLEEEWAQRLRHLDGALGWSDPAQFSKQNAGGWASGCSELRAKAAAAIWAELRYGAASRAPLIRCAVDNQTSIERIAWSPKDAVLATAGKEILLWNFSARESTEVARQSCALDGSSGGPVSSLGFSADGKVLIVRRDKRWEIVSVAEKKVVFACPPTESLLGGDPFSPDGTLAVSRPQNGPPHIIGKEIPDVSGSPPNMIRIELPNDPGVELTGPPLNGGVVAWSPKGDRLALADEKRMINVYSISKTGATLLLPKAFEAFAQVAPLRAASNTAIEVKELAFDASGKFLLVTDEKGLNPLFEIWEIDSTGAIQRDRTPAQSRAWIPNRSLLLHIPLGDGPAVILHPLSKVGRALPIRDPGRSQFSADGSQVLFIQSKRNQQVLDLETGYPVTAPFGWWTNSITARLSLHSGLIASLESKTHLAFWDLRPEQPRWHADPPQPPPVAPVRGPHTKWKSASFSSADLIDLPGLAKKLGDGSDPLSQFVLEHFSADSRKALTDPHLTFDDKTKAGVAEELNKILKGGPIYSDERFAKIELSGETIALKAKDPQGDDLARLNRLLLEGAYPRELRRNQWIADINVDQRVQVTSSDDEHPSVVINLDEQPSSAGWSEDGRSLRVYSPLRGYIDLEWDPPTEVEEPVRKLIQLLTSREHDVDKTIPEKRFKLRQEMPKWKAKDPRWQKLLDWWNAGRPSEPPGPRARLITETLSDDAISSAPAGRDPLDSKWVFHDSNIRALTDADLRGLSDNDLWRARNEIYVRRGVKLGGDRARKLIESIGSEFHDSGVKPDDAFDLMNGVEKANIMLIKSVESQRLVGQ